MARNVGPSGQVLCLWWSIRPKGEVAGKSTVVRIHGCGGLVWRCDWNSWNTDEENQLVGSDARDPFNDGTGPGRSPRVVRLEFASTFTVTSRIGRAHGIHEAQALSR
jgi:hypothetical protein